MSCSLERPPMITPTRIRPVTGLWRGELPDDDRDLAALGSLASSRWILALDDVVLVRIGNVHALDLHVKALVAKVLHRDLLLLSDLVRNGRARSARDRDRDDRALVRLGTG